MPLSTMASAMVSYSLRPPRKGFPLIEKVFQAFHAMTGVRRGGTPAGTAKLSSAGFAVAAATTATKTAKQSATIVAAPLLRAAYLESIECGREGATWNKIENSMIVPIIWRSEWAYMVLINH
eukprot:COSAG01_NODE_3531_length_5963_cov_101.190655_5_plen_122_part_00